MKGLHERPTKKQIQQLHKELIRLGWKPHSIFQTSKGTWAFPVA